MVQCTRFRPWVGRTLQLNSEHSALMRLVENPLGHYGNYTSATFPILMPPTIIDAQNFSLLVANFSSSPPF